MQKDISVGSYQYSQGNQFYQSQQNQDKLCHFCTGINLTRCMTISVFNKHNEEPNFHSKLIQKLVHKTDSPLIIKYEELLKNIDNEEKINRYYPKSKQNIEIKQLLQYYKYRKFVPVFGDLRLGKILNSYYYLRLKLYYNQIKKKLNLTVEPSSDTEFTHSDSISVSRQYGKSKILNDLSHSMQGICLNNIEQVSNLQNYRTESKALQDLVNFLKSNQKFKFVRPLNVEVQWQKNKITSKQMFKDTILQKNKDKEKGLNKGKSKIFITFYSRQSPQFKSNKNTLRNLKSQKLIKSKDVKKINKSKQIKIIQKLQRIKNQIIEQKQTVLSNRQSSKKNQQNSNLNHMSAKNLFKQQSNLNFIKTKQNQGNPGPKTPIKLRSKQKKHKDFIKIIGSEKIIIGNVNDNKNSSPYVEKIPRIISKQKRSQSQSKLNKKTDILQKNKSINAITNKDVQKFVSTRKLFLQKQQSSCKKLKIKQQTLKQPPKRRKSLDLTKMKSNLEQGGQLKVQFLKKQDFLTLKYNKLIQSQKPSIQIRTTNVSPVNKRRQKDNLDEILFQKSDNIISIKKKKLQLLKKRMELQRTDRK